MTSWTPARSILLSQLLDDVVGTEEMVHIRQDYCRIQDCMKSSGHNTGSTYYTGSKAEGLDLPGSDFDFMFDINNAYNMQVIQTEQHALDATQRPLFMMSTENVRPCFAMLRSVRPIRDRELLNACQEINSYLYLSSYLYVHNVQAEFSKDRPDIATTRQGPSIEIWTPYMDRSQSGADKVFSIHCSFWPNAASEWLSRSRNFAWPSPRDIKIIVDFGFQLVPVGHPHSDMNMMEWRLSFSVAERTLVWSFNHVQMQCYAVMKLVLKEFIHPNCSPPCRVLCSYFIKTFLFWEYEDTDPSYWCKENFRECVMRLMSDFHECVRTRSLKHYFILSFNLLSVKMTDDARKELLRIFGIILQSDISIFKECETLKKVWDDCLNHGAGMNYIVGAAKKNLLRSDVCMMTAIDNLQYEVLIAPYYYSVDICTLTSQFVNQFHMDHTGNKTYLASFAIGILFNYTSISLTFKTSQSTGNKTLYKPRRFLQSNVSRIDISTSMLWYAMLMTKCGDYRLSLRVVNQVLSSVSPFALYFTGNDLRYVSNETKTRYADMFSSNDTRVTERARRAWMFDLRIMPIHMDMVPAAIHVELVHCDDDYGVWLSPFVCAYYLMFLNYCGLRQYDNRDRALRQLMDVVKDPEQRGLRLHHSFNIAGHCLLSVGEIEQARIMLMRSYQFTLSDLRYHRYNSAQYYLQFLSNNTTNY